MRARLESKRDQIAACGECSGSKERVSELLYGLWRDLCGGEKDRGEPANDPAMAEAGQEIRPRHLKRAGRQYGFPSQHSGRSRRPWYIQRSGYALDVFAEGSATRGLA